MAVKIEVEKSGNNVVLRSPEHPLLAARAAALGGKEKSGAWTFPGAKEDAVRSLARELWGTNGKPGKTCTLRVELSLYGEGPLGRQGEAWLCGRLLARRRTFDAPVELGPGVKLVSGSFASWGGSPGRPALGTRYGTVVDVSDIPEAAGATAEKEYPYEVKVVVSGEAAVGAWSRTVTDRIAGMRSRAEAKIAGKEPKPPKAAPPPKAAAPAKAPAAPAAPAKKAAKAVAAKAEVVKAAAKKASKKATKKAAAAAKAVKAAAKKASKKVMKKAAVAAKAVKAAAKKAASKVAKKKAAPAPKPAKRVAKKAAKKATKKAAPKRPAAKVVKKAAKKATKKAGRPRR